MESRKLRFREMSSLVEDATDLPYSPLQLKSNHSLEFRSDIPHICPVQRANPNRALAALSQNYAMKSYCYKQMSSIIGKKNSFKKHLVRHVIVIAIHIVATYICLDRVYC